MQAVVVLGAPPAPGRLRTTAATVAADLTTAGFQSSIVDTAALPAAIADGRPASDYDPLVQEAARTVEEAAAVIVVSPVYRASIPGTLKSFLDLLPVQALCGKPVGIATMGATPHHYLGAERHLRDILTWFGALQVPTAVYLTGADFTDAREPTDAARATLRQMIETLHALAAALPGRKLGPPPLAAMGRR